MRKLLLKAIDLLTFFLRYLLRILYRYRVEGLEHLPREGPLLLITNEISFIGSIATTLTIARLYFGGRLPEPMGMTVEDSFGFSPWGVIMKLGTVYAVPPGPGQSPVSLWAALSTLRAGGVVVINGDGEISWDGGPPPLRLGAAWIALRSGVPIVPFVATASAYEIWPRWASRPHLTGYLTVRIGAPFSLSGLVDGTVDEAAIARANGIISQHMQAAIYS